MSDLTDRYDPASTESDVYRQWLEAGAFTARADRSARVGGDRMPFTIVMPPPNVTAILHVGHGLNNAIQDVIIRWARMRGTEALWVPGTDHAGIATQNVVEKLIASEGTTRFDLGRAAFVQRTEAFVEETGGVILAQLKSIGASADWTRTAYTLSPELSAAVREAFVRLYERGLIYKGHRVIHWCPRCLTSLSDEEAEFNDEPGKLYHVAYPVTGHPGRVLTIATTRPETMLGDVALAVNPDDDRYRDLVGTTVRLPIVNIDIPVIADTYADPAFGTGVVKITPAHDANDFDVGKRHGLAMPVVIDEHARMSEVSDATGRVPVSLRGLDRSEARDRIVELLRTAGALTKVESAPARRATLLPVRHGRRAAPLGSMVRAHGAARAPRPRRRARRTNSDPPRALGGRVRQLAREHPRLEHLAPTLVGSSHSHLVLRGVPGSRQRDREPHGCGVVPALWRSGSPR